MSDIQNISDAFVANADDDFSEKITKNISNSVRPIKDILGNDTVPASMESTSVDIQTQSLEQRKTDSLADNSGSDANADNKEITDIDGDGIPDAYDKDKNMTTSDVAELLYKIGKYAPNPKTMSKKMGNIINTVKSCISRISSPIAVVNSQPKTASEKEGNEMFGLIGRTTKRNGIPKSMDSDQG